MRLIKQTAAQKSPTEERRYIEEEKNKTDKKMREMCSTAGAVLLPQKRRDES